MKELVDTGEAKCTDCSSGVERIEGKRDFSMTYGFLSGLKWMDGCGVD